jgi:histidinol-phosphate aminotransferase
MEIGRRTLLASAVKTDHVNRIRQERAILSRNLSQVQGVREVFPSQANFLLFRCARASEVVDRLFEKGIVVRDRSSMPGLEDCIRVTVGVPAENQLFLRELQRVLEEIEQ